MTLHYFMSEVLITLNGEWIYEGVFFRPKFGESLLDNMTTFYEHVNGMPPPEL